MASTSFNPELAPLFEPLHLDDGFSLKNRLIMGPITRNRAVGDGPDYTPDIGNTVPNHFMVEYYRQRARGGAGLIITEGILTSRQGSTFQNAPGLYNDEQVEGWRKVVDAVHAEGVPIFAQIWHVGRIAHPDMKEAIRSGKPIYAPSAVAAEGGRFTTLPGKPGNITPTAIDDPMELVEEFRQAAVRAKRAGFDGIDILGSGGYLIHQFFDLSSNQRTDKWGGSIENRARFLVEVVRAVATVYPTSRISVKLLPNGGTNGSGSHAEHSRAMFDYILSQLIEMKVAFVTLCRVLDGFFSSSNTTLYCREYDSEEHFMQRLSGPDTPGLLISGNVTSEEAARWVREGKIAAAIYGRAWIYNPDFGNRLQRGLPLDTAPQRWDWIIYAWVQSPAECYTDFEPEGGFAVSAAQAELESRISASQDVKGAFTAGGGLHCNNHMPVSPSRLSAFDASGRVFIA